MADLRNLKRRIGQRLIVGFEGTRVPAELLPTIIDFWAHVGWYAVPNLRSGS